MSTKAHETARNRATVVVGVDGSAGSKEALRWALAEAQLRKAPLRVVHAWTFGYVGGSVDGYPYWGGAFGPYESLGVDLVEVQHAAEALLDRALADARAEAPGLKLERRVVQGPAAEALLSEVGKDDLLVVGARGHGGFAELLLGSVSQQCVHHASCPVVVVHSSQPKARTKKVEREGKKHKPATPMQT